MKIFYYPLAYKESELTELQDIDAQVQKDYPGISIYDAPESEGEAADFSPIEESPESHVQARSMLMPRKNVRVPFGFAFAASH
jgi:hypothetical protein